MGPWRAVAVVGGGECTTEIAGLAEEVGRLLADAGYAVVCGGRGGVMEAACRGASRADGLTVGILPGADPREANAHVAVPIATGLGEARNAIVVTAADALIAIGGEFGTLSEIGFALKQRKPVVLLKSWDLQQDGEVPPGVTLAGSAEDAVAALLRALDPEGLKP